MSEPILPRPVLKGEFMNENESIEQRNCRVDVGDRVHVYFERDALFDCEVMYKPVATGDSWILRRPISPNIYKIHLVQLFCRMDKL
jgi:hypothetical protein